MDSRPTEARHPASVGIHARPAAQVLADCLSAQAMAVAAIGAAIPALTDAAEAAGAALAGGGRMAYAGAGSSGLMALADALELAGTFGIAPERTPVLFAGGAAALMHMRGGVEDDGDAARAEVAALGLNARDAVICVSASGSTPYTLAVAEAARAAGATLIGMASVPGSRLLETAHHPVLIETGAEVISGSTRMGAATAQKVALNMLSVLVGIRLGAVHDGYMVDVVADNAKLAGRAARIVAAISGADEGTARAALVATDGAVKPAVLVARGHAPDAARAALATSGGHLAPHL
ncbi:MAG: N-acetylmuramic acid 6-phosphate etherase [Paracoccaceae bacterium]|nr:MAG: N-acetylmuramic acid 6-phosphate etherase [Paracoccaceae bacterium]